ncbi:MAG: hypothetical protein GF330_01990 [Candidatus Eisenbacteria bacterium]|nr:hypothetical protein [Candidatus Eisenbacteria bacterium]
MMRSGAVSLRLVPAMTLSLALLLPTLCPATALELWSDAMGSRKVSLRGSLKWTNLLSHAPRDTILYPQRWSTASLFRGRLGLEVRPAGWLRAEVAYEHRARMVSEQSGAGGGAAILPPEVPAPYRLAPADESLLEIGGTFEYRHELDRCRLTARAGAADVTVGRQAVGWGRGVLFSAVDIFAPFTPLESDREWRRGIDAVRGQWAVSHRLAVEMIAALGDAMKSSAFIGRVHGRLGDLEAALLAGRRREDDFYGLSFSSPVWNAEVHGELAFFRTPEAIAGGGAFATDDLAVKTVTGASYSFELPFGLPADLPAGVMLLGEYHYSGFGLPDLEALDRWRGESDFTTRLSLGDSQILGRHAGAVQLTYGFATMTPVSLSWVFSPGDASGVVVPALTWVASDQVTLSANGYLPYGEAPVEGAPRSEYGGTPTSGLVQIGFYF